MVLICVILLIRLSHAYLIMVAIPEQITLSHLEQTVYFAALRAGIGVLDITRLSALVTVSRPYAAKLLASMAHKGVLHRVGRGRYVVIPSDVLYGRRSFVADPLQVIDELMVAAGRSDYYVAYQSAAFLYGAADQLPQTLMVAVPRQQRPIDLGQVEILPIQVRSDRFFGTEAFRYHDAVFKIANRERTILDCLDRFDLCGGIDEVARTIARLLPEVDQARLLDYVPRMGNHALTQRLGLLLDRLSASQTVTTSLLDGLAQQVSPNLYLLDPHGASEGHVDPRWHVRENIPLFEDM